MRITLANTGETTLGEKINTFQLSVSGAVFDNSQATRSFTVTGTGIYEMLYEVDNTSDYQTTMKTFTDNLSGKTITVSYDSNDALVTNTFTMPTLTPFASNNIGSISVPYLMAQDFSSLSSFSNHDAAETGGLTIDTNTSGFTLDSYNVAGWSAARAGGESGKCIRICCRTEHGGIGEASRYHGRADSAPLAGIKSGKQVKIAVSFDYGGGYGGYDFGASVAYGYTTTTGAINSTSGGSWGISNPVQFTPYSYDGSYSTTPDHYSYTLSNCTSAYRLSWEIMTTGNKFTKNANHWLYIDNIKVSISK